MHFHKKYTDAIAAAGFFAAACLSSVGIAHAQGETDKPLIEKWLDGEVKANFPAVTYDGPPIILTFSSFLPPTSVQAKLTERSIERLAEATNGKLTIRPYWGGTLSSALSGAFEAISAGIADSGTCYHSFNPGGLGMFGGLSIPFVFNSSVQASMTAEAVYEEFLKKEYESKGVYLLRVDTSQSARIMSKVPISTLEDLKGKKAWASGELRPLFMEALGAAPIALQSSELYSGFESGIVDLIPLHDAGMELFKLSEVGKYRTAVDLWVNSTEFCINQNSFDSLPTDLKQVLYHWAQLWNLADSQLFYDIEAEKARETMKKNGVEFIELTPEETARWQAAVQPVFDNWVKEMTAKGLPADKLVADILAKAKMYGAMTPDEIVQGILDKPIPGKIDF